MNSHPYVKDIIFRNLGIKDIHNALTVNHEWNSIITKLTLQDVEYLKKLAIEMYENEKQPTAEFLAQLKCDKDVVASAIKERKFSVEAALQPWLSIGGFDSRYAQNSHFNITTKLVDNKTFKTHIDAIMALKTLSDTQIHAIYREIPYDEVFAIPANFGYEHIEALISLKKSGVVNSYMEGVGKIKSLTRWQTHVINRGIPYDEALKLPANFSFGHIALFVTLREKGQKYEETVQQVQSLSKKLALFVSQSIGMNISYENALQLSNTFTLHNYHIQAIGNIQLQQDLQQNGERISLVRQDKPN